MPSAWFDSTIAWISAHPNASGLLIFLVAFCDALAVVGIVVPALPLLFAVGALVGLGHIDGPYAVACAALGAFAGDATSFWIGHRWGPTLRGHWPFRRYPQLLDRGERLFRRSGSKGIVVARFVGAVRPFVPAIAGMLRMPLKRYVPASLFAAFAWAAAFLAPGWILGASYDAVAAVADRVALVLGTLAAVIALVWAVVLYTWRWFADHANNLLARALRWTRAHPRLGRYAGALIDPNRPESPSLLLLAVCLFAISWVWFALLARVLAKNEPLLLDTHMHELMSAMRNPLADQVMAALAALGDLAVLGPAALVALLWLLWRRRWIAAAHWLAALAFGLALTAGLEAMVDMPRPSLAAAGFGFPSIAVTMATITLGFFAVLIARELPGRRRVWPYLVAGVWITLLGFARLYLGAHWLSDVLGGVLFGAVWLLGLGIAYRRHVARSFAMKPIALAFYGVLVAAALWHAPRAAEPLLARFTPPAPTLAFDAEQWWQGGWAHLPAQRNEADAKRRWPYDVQFAGALEPLRARLVSRGWRVQPQADWVRTLGLLDDDRAPQAQPVLPATLDGHPEALLLLRQGRDAHEVQAIRLWPAPVRLRDGTPLWLGTTQRLRFARPFGVFGIWLPAQAAGEAHVALRDALDGYALRESDSPVTGIPVLRARPPR
jgi:membrane protein DedA with SNARE-associated domain/membrane-associated phospholipid phosphatase